MGCSVNNSNYCLATGFGFLSPHVESSVNADLCTTKALESRPLTLHSGIMEKPGNNRMVITEGMFLYCRSTQIDLTHIHMNIYTHTTIFLKNPAYSDPIYTSTPSDWHTFTLDVQTSLMIMYAVRRTRCLKKKTHTQLPGIETLRLSIRRHQHPSTLFSFFPFHDQSRASPLAFCPKILSTPRLSKRLWKGP